MTDPVTRYADDVLSGNIIAGPSIIHACERHIRDLENDDYYLDLDEIQYSFDFYTEIVTLEKGPWEGAPFKLFPWQEFVIGSIYGWKRKDNDMRRYREAYIEIAKGSGKSPLIAGIGLRGLCADGEDRAEVYVVARTSEQALVTFRYASNMVERSPELSEHIKITGGTFPYNMTYKGQSFMRRVATDTSGKGKSGVNASTILIDEYHEHDTSGMRDFYHLSVKQRTQPLTVIITNSGVDLTSPCGQEHTYAKNVVSGALENNEYFTFVADLHESDNPFEDDTCWVKTNPSLPEVPGYDYIRSEVSKAKGMPSKRSVVERLLFCKWVDAESPWLDADKWEACEVEELSDESDRADKPCWMAVDLSMKTDLTAVATIWDMGDIYEIEVDAWTPADSIYSRSERDQVPYQVWVDEGYLKTTYGETINYDVIAEHIIYQMSKYNVGGVTFDPYRIDFLEKELESRGVQLTRKRKGRGLKMVRHGQSFIGGARKSAQKKSKLSTVKPDIDELNMPRSIDTAEEMILAKQIRVKYNPVLRSAAMAAIVIQDASENRRFDKRKSNKRIDALIALVMACGFAAYQEKPTVSPFDDPNFDYDKFLKQMTG